jgi:hypothetical protein
MFSMKKVESKEVTSAGSSGSFVQPIGGKQETNEKWSEKYKKSIDCNNPKGFSQRAHCQGKKKKLKENLTEAERTAMAKLRDLSKKYACKDNRNCTDKEKIEKVHQELKKQYEMGLKVEKEHKTGDPKQIVIDHLSEDPKYYTKLKKVESKEATGSGSSGSYEAPLFSQPKKLDSMFKDEQPKKKIKIGGSKKIEATEATGAGSSGSYETPAFGAKSMSPKDWRGASKTQIPGGQFVTIKKKCQKFPYCNQGIDALQLSETKRVVDNIIKNISEKYNIDKEIIKNIISKELRKN